MSAVEDALRSAPAMPPAPPVGTVLGKRKTLTMERVLFVGQSLSFLESLKELGAEGVADLEGLEDADLEGGGVGGVGGWEGGRVGGLVGTRGKVANGRRPHTKWAKYRRSRHFG